MKTRLLSLVLVFVAAAAAAQAQGPAATNTLTNASVVKLVRAGFREKTVVAIINARPVSFDLSPDRLIELKKGDEDKNETQQTCLHPQNTSAVRQAQRGETSSERWAVSSKQLRAGSRTFM